MDGEAIPTECYDLPAFEDAYIEDLLPQTPPKRARISPISPASSSTSGRFTSQSTLSLYNIKIRLDPSWTQEDYIKICRHLFDEESKILVVAEKLTGPNTNPHVHIQGYSYYTKDTITEKCRKIVKPMHFQMKPGPGYNPKARPISTANADELGFQYCVKEAPNAVAPIYQRGFTPEQLMELHEKSQEHVKNMKFNIQDLLWEALEKEPGILAQDPERVLIWAKFKVIEKMREENKKMSGYTKKDILNALLLYPASPKPLLLYVMDKF